MARPLSLDLAQRRGGAPEARGFLLPNRLPLVATRIIIDSMRKQIAFSIPEQEANRLESLLNGRTAYAFALEALREKMSREEGVNR
jgi:hypothetical protein